MQLRTEEEIVETTFDKQEDLYTQSNNTQSVQKDDSWLVHNDTPYVSVKEPKKTRKEFYKSIERHKERSNITVAAVIVYVLAGVNIILNSTLFSDSFVFVDIILLIGLALGIQFKQSRVCAGILLGYAILNTVLSFITTGRFSGLLLILAGVYALKGTMDFNKEWKWYCEN